MIANEVTSRQNATLAIYDAITQPSRWKATFDLLAAEIGAVGGGLYMRRNEGRP